MKKYDYPISVIRILALLIVLVLHVRQSCNMDIACFPYYIGVPLFLLISGFLFGLTDVTDAKDWYIRRFKRIQIPYWLLLCLNVVVGFFLGKTLSLTDGIQGLLALPAFPKGHYGMAHTWYITYILLCYLLVPPVFKGLKHCTTSGGGNLLMIGVLGMIMPLTFLTSYIPFIGKISSAQIHVFLAAFFVAYFLRKRTRREVGMTFSLLGGCLYALLYQLSTRLAAWEAIIDIYKHSCVSLAFFGALFIELDLIDWNKIVTKKVDLAIHWIDRNSYYIYLSHYWFTAMSWWNVFKDGLTLMSVLLFVILTSISTILLSGISETIIKKIK